MEEGGPVRRILVTVAVVAGLSGIGGAVAWACGGLVNPNGTVSLTRTTTLAGYRWGVEHYITSFEFQGGGAKFGSIVPLPDIPSKVRRGGDWTLKRLVQEVTPQGGATSGETDASAPNSAEEIYETEIDSVKITILRGGGDAVGQWAKDNGFALPPDAPEVLDHYARMSKIFMALRFDPKDAEDSGKEAGDGVPIHLNIPTDNPWVPFRILSLGQDKSTFVEADVFLLTKREPGLRPAPKNAGANQGTILERSERASQDLLNDLRTDRQRKGSRRSMKWVDPDRMWLSYLRINEEARDLTYDLSARVPERRVNRNTSDTREVKLPASAVWSWAAPF
jgi:Uncharacterized protein conserved in bacteria (DUF2330)